MPKNSWSAQRERQYQHIRASELQEGKSEKTAEEIAARTVNKVRAQHGEARTSSAPSQPGQRAHPDPAGRTKALLYQEARQRNIAGRSSMSKAQLQSALDG